jgi:hypothetical protein
LAVRASGVADVRNIALPDFLVEELRTHMKKHAGPGSEGLLFRASAAATTRELMHRMGHGSTRAALITSTGAPSGTAQEMAALGERKRRPGGDDPSGSEGVAEAGWSRETDRRPRSRCSYPSPAPRQARKHIERVAETERRSASQAKLLDERRSAYISVLRVAELDLRRARYKSRGQTDKLAEIESKWPKGARVEMTHEAVILVELFGSDEARRLVATWQAASQPEHEQQMQSAYEAFRVMARRELAEGLTPTSDP